MATRTTVLLTDDMDGSEADETVSFAMDGVAYEIDLSQDNANDFRDSMSAYMQHGRKVSGRSSSSRATNIRRPTNLSGEREQREQVRVWARENGFQIGDRGRIAQNIIDAYEEAHTAGGRRRAAATG